MFGLKNIGAEDWREPPQELKFSGDLRIESLTRHQLAVLIEKLESDLT
jgi:hypothetical protein